MNYIKKCVDNRLKILFICNEYPPEPHGGVGTFIKTLGHGLVEHNHQITVIGVYPNITNTIVYDDKGINVHKLPKSTVGPRLGLFLDRINISRYIMQFLKQNQIDLIEAPEGGGWSIFLSKSPPVIIRLHNSVPFFLLSKKTRNRGRLVELIENLALRRSARVIAVSNFMRTTACKFYKYARLDKKEIQVIYNGVDTETFQYFPYDRAKPGLLVFAGTLKPMKGIDLLIRAFIELCDQNKTATLAIYGKDTEVDGKSYKEMLHTMIPDAIKNRVIFFGPKPHKEMPSIFSKASFCIFPSALESFGLVAAEAMACGRAVIYASSGAARELIKDGINGYLCSPQDHHTLKLLIERLLNSTKEIEQVGINARKTIIEEFSLVKSIRRNENFYYNFVETNKKI